MARLHEYQGKVILAANGFNIPRGRAASTADDAVSAAKELAVGKTGTEVVVKIQAWTTGRAGIGGVMFAKRPDDVRGHAARMLEMKVGRFPETVLVEEKVDSEREFFLSFAIDDAARAPIIIFAAGGGTGIEERAASTKRIDPVKHGYDGPPPRGISDGNPKSPARNASHSVAGGQDPNPREKGDQR
jgi:succinyl-CoA synthetase beta subunit